MDNKENQSEMGQVNDTTVQELIGIAAIAVGTIVVVGTVTYIVDHIRRTKAQREYDKAFKSFLKSIEK